MVLRPDTALEPSAQGASLVIAGENVGFPALIEAAGQGAAEAFLEFFTATIANTNTRRSYLRAVVDFLEWSEARGLALEDVKPWHVAGYREFLQGDRRKRVTKPFKEGTVVVDRSDTDEALSKASVKQHIAALRMFFDHLVVRQVLPFNPSSSVRSPKLVVRKGKTPVLWEEDLQQLFAIFETSTVLGLRDRAVISVMFFTVARVGAVAKLRVKDYVTQERLARLSLQEKGGVENTIIVHPICAQYLDEYLAAAGIGDQAVGPLFRSTIGRSPALTERPMGARTIQRMVKRRLLDAGLNSKASPHSLRASGLTIFAKNGGDLEAARKMAHHASARTTQLYIHQDEEVSLEEVTRIRF